MLELRGGEEEAVAVCSRGVGGGKGASKAVEEVERSGCVCVCGGGTDGCCLASCQLAPRRRALSV